MKLALTIIAVLIGLYSYYPYFKDIFANKTKPHTFTWLVWSILTGIGFVAQIQDGGGAGAWVTGFTAFACFCIFLLSLKKGEKDIKLSDWLCLVGAFIAIGFWIATDDPLISVILITLIDAVAFIPTFRKAFNKPFEETSITFTLSTIKFTLAILALSNFTIVTVLFPASLVLTNGLFVVMLYARRKKLAKLTIKT